MGLVLVGCASCAMPRLRALTRALEQHAAPERPGRSGSVAMPLGDEGALQRQDRARFTRKQGSVHGLCVSLSPPCANRLARPRTGRHDAAIADRNPTAPAKLAGATVRTPLPNLRTLSGKRVRPGADPWQ
jgi:hypothetical protein